MPRATGNREDRLFSLSFRHKIRQGDFLLNSLRLKVGLTVHQRGPVSLAEGRLQRMLAVITSADMVGYLRLMTCTRRARSISRDWFAD
jgi:hypothetical protein